MLILILFFITTVEVMEKKPYLILMASQKGGVGKTTIALNLAVALIYRKFKVLLVDGDVESASLSEQLGIRVDGDGFYDVVNGKARIEDVLFAYEPIDLHIIPGGSEEEEPYYKPENLSEFYSKLKKLDYDFIIVDSQPGPFAKEVAKYFDDVAILTTPDLVSSKASSKMAEYCQKYKLEHRLIINRVGYSKYDLDKDGVEALFRDVVFQMIPEDQIVEESISKHKPAYMLDRKSDFSVSIEEVARDYALKMGGSGEDRESEFEERKHGTALGKFGDWFFRRSNYK